MNPNGMNSNRQHGEYLYQMFLDIIFDLTKQNLEKDVFYERVNTQFKQQSNEYFFNLDVVLKALHLQDSKKNYKSELSEYDKRDIMEIFNYIVKHMTDIKIPKFNMEWIGGEHALLYDFYKCKDCNTLVKTTDDVEEFFIPPYCPKCNNINNHIWQSVLAEEDHYYPTLCSLQIGNVYDSKRSIIHYFKERKWKRMFYNVWHYIVNKYRMYELDKLYDDFIFRYSMFKDIKL